MDVNDAADAPAPPAGHGGWVAVCFALPIVAVTAVLGSVALAERAGLTPFTEGPARNMAEAAGMGQPSEVLRFLRFGISPARIYPVRAHVISSAVTRVTPMEAAIWSRRVELVALLDAAGAIVGADERHHLACLAADLGTSDIVEYLAPDGPSCEAGRAIDAVMQRTP